MIHVCMAKPSKRFTVMCDRCDGCEKTSVQLLCNVHISILRLMMGSELLAHVHVCFQCCVVNCNVQSSVTCMFCEFLSGTLTCSMFLAVVMFLRSFGTSFLVVHDLCEGVFNVHRCIVVQRLHMYEECQCGIMSRNVRDTTMCGGRSNVLK